MKIRLLSDLHLEFHGDGAASFIQSLKEPECDVLVLAGDIGVCGAGLEGALRRFASLFHEVVYVAGNHSYYGSSPESVTRKLTQLAHEVKNLHWLENSHVEIGGRRFIGSTLWYPEGGPTWAMNDFGAIRNFTPWVYERNAESQKYLADNVQPGDVVVTHMLPHPKCTHPKFAGSPLNHFFMCDQSRVIEDRKPTLALFGHTHESMDFVVGDTRFVCNPYGYFGYERNCGFDPEKIIEV